MSRARDTPTNIVKRQNGIPNVLGSSSAEKIHQVEKRGAKITPPPTVADDETHCGLIVSRPTEQMGCSACGEGTLHNYVPHHFTLDYVDSGSHDGGTLRVTTTPH